MVQQLDPATIEVGGPNPVDLDGLGVDWPIRVDFGAPRLALAPALAFAQHFDETDFDDDARGSPGKRLLANELGVRCTLASRLRVEGDEPVETVEEIRQVHRGAPKQRRTRFGNRRHGVRPNSQVSKTGLRADRARPRVSS